MGTRSPKSWNLRTTGRKNNVFRRRARAKSRTFPDPHQQTTVCGTGLIEDARCLYSRSLPYRMQSDALLPGHLDLSDKPTDIKFEMAWAKGGVLQGWGLGVPFWRLAFEVAVRSRGFAQLHHVRGFRYVSININQASQSGVPCLPVTLM